MSSLSEELRIKPKIFPLKVLAGRRTFENHKNLSSDNLSDDLIDLITLLLVYNTNGRLYRMWHKDHNDKLCGEFKVWHDNGQIQHHQFYKNNKLVIS